jgi:hypothetical protein
MVPLLKKLSQGSQRRFSIQLLVTLVGAVSLGVAFLMITPIHATPGSFVSQAKISGGGCTTAAQGDLKICVNAKNGKAVSSATINLDPCPKEVLIKLFDDSGLVDTTTKSGCGKFSGPTAPLKKGNEFVAQVVADGSAIPSPRLKAS